MKNLLSGMLCALAVVALSTGCEVNDGNANDNMGGNVNDNTGDGNVNDNTGDGNVNDNTGDGNENMNDGGDDVSADFDADLTGDAEVPPVTTDASGSASFIISDDEATVDFDISAAGLSGPVTGMHFHMAEAGANGDVIVNLTSFIENGDDGTMTATGSVDVDAEVVTAIRDGNVYLNLHTAANPGGEIRGQLTETTE